jgi:hypothetical protein
VSTGNAQLANLLCHSRIARNIRPKNHSLECPNRRSQIRGKDSKTHRLKITLSQWD